jgi:regulatory protein
MFRKEPKKTITETSVGLLARREHSVAEMQRKLREKGYGAAEVQACVDKLVEKGLLSDARYAAARARYRAGASKWGWMRIAMELKANGVGSDEIEAAKAALEEEGVDFAANAAQLAERMGDTGREKKMARLGRKGFSGAQIRGAVDDGFDDI